MHVACGAAGAGSGRGAAHSIIFSLSLYLDQFSSSLTIVPLTMICGGGGARVSGAGSPEVGWRREEGVEARTFWRSGSTWVSENIIALNSSVGACPPRRSHYSSRVRRWRRGAGAARKWRTHIRVEVDVLELLLRPLDAHCEHGAPSALVCPLASGCLEDDRGKYREGSERVV